MLLSIEFSRNMLITGPVTVQVSDQFYKRRDILYCDGYCC